MIDINIIKANGKYYSVKCDLKFSHDDEDIVTVMILSLDMVEPTGTTSFMKIKSLFKSETSNDILSRLKYPYIYEALTKKLIQKYKMKVLNIWTMKILNFLKYIAEKFTIYFYWIV